MEDSSVTRVCTSKEGHPGRRDIFDPRSQKTAEQIVGTGTGACQRIENLEQYRSEELL